jgi:hypothetical protein
LLPSRDIFYGALTLAALVVGWHYYHKYEEAVQYAAELREASVDAALNANEIIKSDQADYDAKLKAAQEAANAQINIAMAHANDLTSRLRKYEANRNRCSVLQGAAPAPAGGTDGSGGVEGAVADLIAAAVHDNAVCTAERAERDALTGK